MIRIAFSKLITFGNEEGVGYFPYIIHLKKYSHQVKYISFQDGKGYQATVQFKYSLKINLWLAIIQIQWIGRKKEEDLCSERR